MKERGNAYFVRHQFAEAAEWYSRAIDADPDAPDLLTNRAAAFARLGDWDRGLADARASVAAKPDWIKGHFRIGACCRELGDLDAAEAAFAKALALEPDNRQVAKELEAVRAAARDAPRNAEKAKQAAEERFRLGDYDAARALYEVARTACASEEREELNAAIAECTKQMYR